MRARITQLRRDQRGVTLIIVGAGFMALMAATTLAIDVGMFMMARSQAQNAADSGALAGAVALVFNDFDNRTSSGPAVQSAIGAARANQVVRGNVSVTSADVTFPTGPTGNNRVAVTVRRTAARSNPVPTLIGPFFGVPTVDIMATATAEASPANAETCVMPFTIPDKWIERQTGAWDVSDTFDMYDNRGNALAAPDTYVPPGQRGATGYSPTTDRGLQLVLKSNNTNKTAPSFYNPWDLPGSTGADDYRNNIANCNTNIVALGDPMNTEPGNMVGPTAQGTTDLIARDPDAYWDAFCACVKGSAFGKSPRVAIVPLYDPVYYETGKRNGNNASLRVANYIGFFIERMQGQEVVGRITPISGLVKGGGGPVPTGAFPMAIRLVQ
ncbi:MAG TPA: TadE/TadG family type IV pilus assembly protein [Vicinamibacterales bacterium]|nr:TadE/TadG family type IV pilus assembly protein [Vicinamibacterales bacterium]